MGILPTRQVLDNKEISAIVAPYLRKGYKMLKNLTNPITNKTYTYKGFTPLSRLTPNCKNDDHSGCLSAPQLMVAHFGFDFTKEACCLCGCHFDKK